MSIDASELDQQLLKSNIRTLEEGAELIGLLKVDQYTQGFKPAFQSTIGAHFRHILEHYLCFLAQLPDGVFCYDKRERDQLLECDSSYALKTIDDILSGLRLGSLPCEPVKYFIEDEQTNGLIETNVNRELLFLQSHTVHHYAIIGAMTRAFGNQPDEDFGVAIATRVHNEKNVETTPAIVKGASCAQ